ncbi:MAG: hypothetical protein GF317_08255 [Candidatus Lokiarchaeota archaeon]|nr:hypothetical protein [Candidatus Lokiarchaeota archaeon]MBD3199703.1 hypothetical protein [Candidatus Lokiarchaeota archaeon]
MGDNLKKDLTKMKGIVICKESGEYLVDLILDMDINPILLSSFVGALSLFGKDNLGKIEEILIKGLDVEMIIVNKYNLVLIAILGKELTHQDIRGEAEKALDNFYELYKEEIKDCIDVCKFDSFKKILQMQVEDYFQKLTISEKEEQVQDFGFFTEAIKKMKKS